MTPSAAPVLVVLAAGASRRLGQPKALVQLGQRTALERLLDAGSSCADRLVVTGAHDPEIRSALAATAVAIVTNAAWASGRTGSIAMAQAARPERDLLIAPVDVPLVSAGVIEALLAAWAAAGAPERGFLAPLCRAPSGAKRHGHPVVVGRRLARELAAGPPDRSLREVRDAAAPRFDVAVDDSAVLDDLDCPADLAALRRRLELSAG